MATTNFEEKRKHKRFSDRSFSTLNVNLIPVPPLFGEPATGTIVDLSAGGMAIALGELIPRKMMMRMTLSFKDGTQVQSVVLVRRAFAAGRGGPYLHGMEFLNMSPEDVQRIEDMARDSLSCEERQKAQVADICQAGCRFASMCMRPQRNGGAQEPVRIEFTNVDAETSIARLRAKYEEVVRKPE